MADRPRQTVVVPPGTPQWITAEMIANTLRVWQPYYEEPLTELDAVEMMHNVAELGDILGWTKAADRAGVAPEESSSA